MDIKEKAEIFAIQAHDGEYRKADPDKPYVVHPIDVANKLKRYGFRDVVSASGYLHDVVENTRYCLEDIQNVFGWEVASFVRGATESSKLYKLSDARRDVSWYDRKKETIERVKGLDLEHKAIVTVDKISNLEDMSILFGKQGKVDFSKFNTGYEDHRWYYNGIYESLVSGMDAGHPMFRDLRNLIDCVFEHPDTSFSGDKDSILSYKKQELLKLRGLFQENCTSLPAINFSYGCDRVCRDRVCCAKDFCDKNSRDREIYLKIKEKLDKLGIDSVLYGEGERQIWYHDLGAGLLVNSCFDGHLSQTRCEYGWPVENSECIAADFIVKYLMDEMYWRELDDVNWKIRKKKRISLN